MREHRGDGWAAMAVLQAVAIVLLAWLLWDDAAEMAEPTPSSPLAAAPSPGQPARVEAEEPNAAPQAPSTPAAVATRDAVVADELSGTLVHGQVRHRAGTPLQDIMLQLFRGDATTAFATTPQDSRTHFAWPGIQPDVYRLSIRSDGMRTLEHTFVVPPATADVRLDLVLEPSWLLKVVLQTPGGRPWHEAFAEIVKARPALRQLRDSVAVLAGWNTLPEALPLSDGGGRQVSVTRWQSAREAFGQGNTKLPARYAGVLDVPETRAVVVAAVFGNVVLVQTAVEPGQPEVTLVIDPNRLLAQLATVRLQVVDATTHEPIPTARVTLQDGQGRGRPQLPVDAEGRIEVRDLLPGLHELSITAKDRMGPSVSVGIAPGSVTDLGQIPVGESFALYVRVTGRTADKEMRCQLLPIDAVPNTTLRAHTLYLGARGDETSVSIAAGRYQLLISGAGGALVEFDTRALGKEPLVVALQPEAMLRFDTTNLPEPTRLVLRTSTGAVVFDRWLTWKGAWEQPLLPGTYTIELDSLNGPTRREELAVPADGARYVLR